MFSMLVHAGLRVPERGLGSDWLVPRNSEPGWWLPLSLWNWAKSCSEKDRSRFRGIRVSGSGTASVLGESSSYEKQPESMRVRPVRCMRAQLPGTGRPPPPKSNAQKQPR